MKTFQCDRCDRSVRHAYQLQGQFDHHYYDDGAEQRLHLGYKWGQTQRIDLCGACQDEFVDLMSGWYQTGQLEALEASGSLEE